MKEEDYSMQSFTEPQPHFTDHLSLADASLISKTNLYDPCSAAMICPGNWHNAVR